MKPLTEDLHKSVADHKRWLESKGRQGKCCTFTGDLSGYHFKDMNLKRCVLIGCNLRGAIFENVNLSEARFINCKISNAEFIGCEMSYVSILDTIGYRTKFKDCIIAGGSFRNTHFIEPEMKDVKLTRSDITSCTVEEGRFHSLILSGSNFANVSFKDSDINSINMDFARCEKVEITDCSIKSASLFEISCNSCRLTGELTECRFTQGVFIKTDLNAAFANCDFENAYFYECQKDFDLSLLENVIDESAKDYESDTDWKENWMYQRFEKLKENAQRISLGDRLNTN